MENIEMILIKYILGFGLQSFLLVFAIYTFNRQEIIKKDFLITSMLVFMITYIMKLLPITIGVQTIMNMIFMYMVCVIYLKMQPYITIRSTSFCVVLILLSEMVVTALAVMIYGQEKFLVVVNDVMQKHYIGVFANIVFAIFIISIYFILNRKGDYHRSISEQDS